MSKIYGPYRFGKVDRENVEKLDTMLREMVAEGAWVRCPVCKREFPAEFANSPEWGGPENLVGVCMECGLMLCHPCYDAHCPCDGKPKLHIIPCTIPEGWRS